MGEKNSEDYLLQRKTTICLNLYVTKELLKMSILSRQA